MKDKIEIPFGAHDSELKGWEYTIPEGFTAEIKDGKVIVRERANEDERMRKMLIDRVRSAEELTDELREWILTYLEGQKECVADSSKAFVDEDERIRKELINVCNDWLNGDYSAKPCLKDIKWLKNLLEKQKEQKPADSEEKFESIDNAFRRGREVGFREGVESVKQSAEWSEEDDALLKEIVSFFKDGTVKLQHDLDLYAGFLQNKFKSLRPHWKPSEEQMQYLLAVINNPYNAGAESCHLTLGSLYNDLKKLM